jgi:hypothetical protein
MINRSVLYKKVKYEVSQASYDSTNRSSFEDPLLFVHIVFLVYFLNVIQMLELLTVDDFRIFSSHTHHAK